MLALAACRTDPPASPYSHDLERLCNVSVLSAADARDPMGRMVMIAKWLDANLETPEARAFLVQIQPLEGLQKAEALDGEARRFGLASCPLAAEWRGSTHAGP